MLSRIRDVGRVSVTLFALCLLIPSFIVPAGTRYAYLGWTGIGPPYTGVGLRVAVVKPVFTATAYSSSFYVFYDRHKDDPQTQLITTDLDLLNISVVDNWGWSKDLGRYITSVVGDYGLGTISAQSLTILSDIDVTEGGLFNQTGSSRFDVLVLGFTEYVTSQEYHDYQHFVASGGRLIIMDASNFVAEVRYYPQTNHLALVRGHGWSFDGTKVWRDVFQRWQDENTNWVGSNECCTQNKYAGANIVGNYPISDALQQRFGNVVFRSYPGHEENGITNMTYTTILARWQGSNLSPRNIIAAYMHRYTNGTVVHIGVMSSDVVNQDVSIQFFLLSAIVDSTRIQGQLGTVPQPGS